MKLIETYQSLLQAQELDNPIWHSLTGCLSYAAEASFLSIRMKSSFGPFAAVREESCEGFNSLAELLPLDTSAMLFLNSAPEVLPESLTLDFLGPLVQMICNTPTQSLIDARICKLEQADLGAMIDLAQCTKPGPFAARTNELGTYFGIKQGKQLVAMVGERLQADRFTEISAVCTHPEYRGRGFAKLLLNAMCNRILSIGRHPILHVRPDNVEAVHTYLKVGFREYRRFKRCILKRVR
ncbi:MAG: GNAT family N-acetyltransferase [Candidatus Obscuribacterales bacterium]|nr:GNAT family N-acetyltransferase [Candidatus Obscuribacterales bacterium]